MAHPQQHFLPALTGYRAIAAWLIFVFHLLKPNTHWPQWLQQVVGQFHIGVDMFFVLSGFLIAYRYYRQVPLNFRSYMMNRIARIYPMYFLLTIAVFVISYLQNGWSGEKTIEAVLSFTLTKALFSNYTFVGIDTGWTLTIEEIFYLCAPLYFVLVRKSRQNLVYIPVAVFLFGTLLKYLFTGSGWGFMQNNIAVYVFEFFAGIALAVFLKAPKRPTRGLVTYGALAFLVGYLLAHAFLLGRLQQDWAHAADAVLLSCLGIAPLLYGLIYERTLVQKILSWPVMILLGKSSYIFYLIHKGWVTNMLYDFVTPNVALIFILLNIISVGLFYFIEEPANLWIRAQYKKRYGKG